MIEALINIFISVSHIYNTNGMERSRVCSTHEELRHAKIKDVNYLLFYYKIIDVSLVK